jgi:hypothetical protein
VTRFTREDLVDLFRRAEPEEVLRAVDEAAARLGLRMQSYERSQALATLDEMSRSDGAIGISAAFAKARVLLLPKAR